MTIHRARKILIGVATWIGFIGFAVAAAAPVLTELQMQVADTAANPNIYAIGGLVLAAFTAIGRYGQSMVVAYRKRMTDGEEMADEAAPLDVEVDSIPVDPHEGSTAL